MSIASDAHGIHTPHARVVRHRKRFLLAVSGILCLVAAHCLTGFVLYQHLHRGQTKLVSSDDATGQTSDDLIDSLESSMVRKSISQEKPPRIIPKFSSRMMPARTIKKDLMDGWWEELRPEKQSLRQEGEAYLSAYDSVKQAKVRAASRPFRPKPPLPSTRPARPRPPALRHNSLSRPPAVLPWPQRELSSVQAVVSAARQRARRRRPAAPAAMAAQRTTELLQDAGDGVDALGLDVPPLRFAISRTPSQFYIFINIIYNIYIII